MIAALALTLLISQAPTSGVKKSGDTMTGTLGIRVPSGEDGIRLVNNTYIKWAATLTGGASPGFFRWTGTTFSLAGPVTSTGAYTSTVASGSNGFALSTTGARLDLGAGSSDWLRSDGTNIEAGTALESTVASGSTAFTMLTGAKLCFDTAGAQCFSIQNTDQLSWSGTGRLVMPNVYTGLVVSNGSFSGQMGITGMSSNGASAIGVNLSNFNALSTAGSKLVSVLNSSTEKAHIDRNGSIWIASATLDTCAAGIEGKMSRDTASGGTTGNRTTMCLCTSNGAGTPSYAWQNMVTGTVGSTTGCPP